MNDINERPSQQPADWKVVKVVATVAGLIIVACIFAPPISITPRPNSQRSSCQSNLKQVVLGFKQYTQDFDEQFPVTHVPPAGLTVSQGGLKGTHWVHALQPYLKSLEIFQCPVEPSKLGTDYYYNAFVSGRNEVEINDSNVVVILTEGVDTANARLATASGPQTSDAEPPSFARHLEGSNYAFVDGHVKWLHSAVPPKPKDLTGKFTFIGQVREVKP